MFGIEGRGGGSEQGSQAVGLPEAPAGGCSALDAVEGIKVEPPQPLAEPTTEEEAGQEEQQELKSEHVEEEAAEEAGQVLAPAAAAAEAVAPAGPTVLLGGRRMPALCRACGTPAISPEQCAFLKDPKNVTGRRDTQDPDGKQQLLAAPPTADTSGMLAGTLAACLLICRPSPASSPFMSLCLQTPATSLRMRRPRVSWCCTASPTA
jgi:hypothetical protein